MKKQIKKLTLNRETVRLLTDGEAAQVEGGTLNSRETKICCQLSISHCSACCP
ncbi:MAG TPA: class I lanthipeptide [Thermoanaerobaculia bacterium]